MRARPVPFVLNEQRRRRQAGQAFFAMLEDEVVRFTKSDDDID